MPPDLTPLAELLARKTDAELLYMAQQAHRYPPELGQGAVRELQQRGLIPQELPEAGPPPVPPAPEPTGTWLGLLRQLLGGIFRPRSGYFITPLLLLSNLAVFGLMAASGVHVWEPHPAELVAWGSNFSPLISAQPWRLVSCLFLHAGPAHLLLNMGALLLLGLLAEDKVGSGRWLLAYLVSGVGGSLASLWWHSRGINSVGASGAIFGLYGLLLALLITRTLPVTREDRGGIIGLLLYFALSSLVGGLEGPNTDNAAHIGGLLTGIFVGFVLAAVSGSPKSDTLPAE
ncbi:rhomboid family intramembrane serine protease [Hymenobacter sp. J193]|uniref:rhomboid family intramembrane serine protease n=1 Tax=Hymenobacter sp. J193 TaxID=2898429 RepID=UPI0021512C23|nr:rhomboid family intramembrane serine protease [Hymenobacter sp. J193]MCR5889072.1 rhomboid family intramembrane serine protease [Hymenobacter sp. J193]